MIRKYTNFFRRSLLLQNRNNVLLAARGKTRQLCGIADKLKYKCKGEKTDGFLIEDRLDAL